jgi:hypothetical protein
MAFRLSKTQNKEFYAAAQVAIDRFSALELAVGEYNEALSELRGMVEGFVEEWRSAYEDRSEKWQESDKGTAANEFIDEWEAFAGELEAIDEVHMPPLEDTPSEEVAA